MDCLKVAELLGEFFEKVTEGLVKLVATVAATKHPVSGAAAVGVVPAQELRTHAAKMQHLMAQTLASLTALVPQQSRGTRLEFARKLLVMRTPWLDSTSLKSHSDVRDVLADGSNDDKLEMVWTSMVLVQCLQMGVVTMSTNPSGAKKMYLLKREMPSQGAAREAMQRILAAVRVSPAQFCAPSEASARAAPPPHVAIPAFLDIDLAVMDACLQALQTW